MTATTYNAATFMISVAGEALSPNVTACLETATADLAAGLPGVAVFRFIDPYLSILDEAGVEIGSPVELAVCGVRGSSILPLFSGEVTALEYEYDGLGAAVSVRCSDKLHRLTRGRRTRSWVQTTEGRVWREVISTAGLRPGTLEVGAAHHDHVAQLGSTDWEFLSGRARATGHEVAFEDGAVHVRRPPPAGRGQPVELEVGSDISRLGIRITSAGQVATVTTAGWDPQQASKVAGQARTPAGTGPRDSAASGIAKAFKPEPLHEGSALITSQAEATARATALAARVAAGHVQVEGWALGDPRLVPGRPVDVRGVSPQVAGRYVLTRTQHVLDRDGYRTRFEVGTSAAVGGPGDGGAAAPNPGIPGVTVGVVTDVKDPLQQGRVKVKLPWLSDTYATDWVRVAGPGAGRTHGLVVTPEVNDEVLLAFAHGDPRLPYVLGGLWSRSAGPPVASRLVDGGSGRVSTRTLMSREGHRVTVSDQPSQGGIELETGDSKMSVTMATASTKVTVSSKGDVLIEGTGQVTVKSSSKLLLEATGALELKGATVTVQATGPVEVKGALIKLN